MADDIDIEEHDVLDNPRIKNIFPDITCIKTEDVYEDININSFDEESYEVYQQDVPTLCQNKIIVDPKPCESTSSKDEEPKILECSVVLEDLGSSLKNNPCFCFDCEILFPTENALDSHKMTAHSFLVAAGRNEAIKSTTKNSIVARLKFETDPNTEISNLCNHCNKVFPDEISFLKHYEELLTRKFSCDDCDLKFESEISLQQHSRTHPGVLMYCCPICFCYFKYMNKIVSHMVDQHQIDVKKEPQAEKATFKCRLCAKIFPNTRRYNAHISNVHTEQCFFKDKITDTDSSSSPVLTFPSAYSEKIHRVSQHDIEAETSSTSVDLDKQIKIEPLSPKITQTVLKQEVIWRPVPKSTLFKCSKCQIHFVSSLVALKHTKRCALKKGNWKCKICRIPFRLVDRHVHTMQHDWTDRFKILTVHENMSNSILCMCVSCKVCSDERTLMRSHDRGCPISISLLCNMCNVNIHYKALMKHMKIHSEMDSESFVVVDFVNVDQSTLSSAIAIKPTIKNLESKKIEKELKELKLYYYYCPTCRCYMKVQKLSDEHDSGKCKIHLQKRLCKLCGLTFSVSSFLTHKKDHKKFPHLKLKDLTFLSTQGGKKVNPPPPYFTKCVNCEVKYYRTVALRNHVCADEAKTCEYCGDMFSDPAYKLHVPFHEYAGEIKMVIKNKRKSDNPDNARAPKKIHRVSQHDIEAETSSKSVDLDKQIKIEPLSPKITKTVLKPKFIWRPVPKSTLFKCSKCQIHFVSSLVALEHTKRCALKKGKWKCKTCRIPFRLVDRHVHTIQHDWTDRFKILTVHENMLNSILCRCVSCKVCSDERTLMRSHERGCPKSISFLCNMCNVNINEKVLTEHIKVHNEMDSESFVVVDFVNVDQSTLSSAIVIKPTIKNVKSKKAAKELKEPKFYYYCPTCRCYMKVKKLSDEHDSGKCKIHLKKRLCNLCGLTFSVNSFLSHKKYHKKFPHLKLKDLTFVSTQGGKKVNPPPPYFTKCVNCEVKYYRTLALNYHDCIGDEPKTCGYCGDIFSDFAYKLHVPFHEYAVERNSVIKNERMSDNPDKERAPKVTHRVSQQIEIESENYSKSVDLNKQIKIEPPSPTISRRVSQRAIKTYSKSVNLDKQIKIEPPSPTISRRVPQHAIKTYSKSVNLDKQINIEPLSPTIIHRVSQHEIEAETSSKYVDLDKQIKIEPLSPTIIHRVSQNEIESEIYSKSVDLDKQIKIEPLSPTISRRVPQHAIKTYSKSVNLDKQINIEPLSPTIIHRVSQDEIEAETSWKSVDLDKQIKIEPLSPKITKTVLKPKFIWRPVPKSTLFKCSKCQIHFVSSLVALEHTKRCALKKGKWKCKTCRIPFRLVDRHVHTIQHDWTDRFKILTVHENMLNSILCRCVSCKVCSDERTLMRSHERGCPKSISFLCNMCNVNINEKVLTEHIKVHNEMDSESFVVVDFVNVDQSTLSSAIVIKPTIKNVKSKKAAKELKEPKFYYYCPTCRCYMKVKKLSDEHDSGKCKIHLKKRLCNLCGLTFSVNSFLSHKKYHKKFPHLKLKDLTFVSTQGGKKVNPPPPYFTKCVKCEVKYYRTLALNYHDCIGDEPKTCGYCGDIFSDFAYKLHVPFHEYAVERNSVIKNERMSDNPDKERAPKVTHRVSQQIEIESENYSKSVDLNKQIKIEPPSPTISRRVSQRAIKTYSKSVNLDKQIKIEPPSPTISRRVPQHAIKTYSKSVNLDKQINIEPLSPTIIHRVSQHEIEAETSSKYVDLDKQIKIEPLSPTIIHRVSQNEIESEIYSKSVDLDKQIKIEPLSPTISRRVPQHAIKTYSKSVNLDKQINIEPLSPTIIHRVSQDEIEAETSWKSVDLDKQIKIEPLSPTIIHRVSQHEIEAETYSKYVDLDKQIKIEPLSPTIIHRVSQNEIESEIYSKSVDLDKQIKIEPPSPTISRRVSQHAIKTYSKSMNLDKQIKIEPLSPKITQTGLKQEL